MSDDFSTMAQEVEAEAEAHIAKAEAVQIPIGETSHAAPEVATKSTPAPHDHRSRAQIQTVRFDSRDFQVSWPMAIATLEQLSSWTVFALRLGTLALIQQCVRELSEPDAPADLIARLRVLTDALARMPLET